MELKVWVEGIQRVVCGVSNETTCQDVVIALAHAMGRTGRFTLVEKWRDIERPLSPTQCPVIVLQKWGEYAGDVKFLLYHSDKLFSKSMDKSKPQQTESKSNQHHALPPDKQPEGNIKRSLTFTGVHNSPLLPPFKRERLKDSNPTPHMGGGPVRNSNETLYEEDSHSTPSASTNVSVRSSPNINIPAPLHGHPKAIPKSKPSYKSNIPNGHIPQAAPRQPMKIDRNNNDRIRAQSCERRIPSQCDNRTRAVSCDRNVPSRLRTSRSPSPYIEEYDLDKNFRHGSYDSADNSGRSSVNSLKGASRQSGGNNTLERKSEFTRLWRLISQQQERLKLQESQLTLLDTEIVTTEEREKRLAEADRQLLLEIQKSESLHEQYEQELSRFDYEVIVSELETEKVNGKQLQTDITDVKAKLSKCEKELVQLHQKIAQFMNSIKTEKSEMEAQEKLQKEMEEKLLKEIEVIKSDIEEKLKHSEKDVQELENLEKEINELESVISEKKNTIDELEKELKDFNMQALERPLSPPTSPVQQQSGEALLRYLEGKLTPRGGSARSLGKTSTMKNNTINQNKGPGGVWV